MKNTILFDSFSDVRERMSYLLFSLLVIIAPQGWRGGRAEGGGEGGQAEGSRGRRP